MIYLQWLLFLLLIFIFFLLQEVYALAALGSHAHILRYYRAWIEDAYLYIQMEYCANGSVGAAFRKRGAQFSEGQLLQLLKQVATGLLVSGFMCPCCGCAVFECVCCLCVFVECIKATRV